MEIKMSNNEDFLLVDADAAVTAMEAAKNKKGGSKKDPELWLLPTIKNATKSYDAQIRLMPRGVNGLKNKIHPTVPHVVHYVKDKELNLFTTIPCRKTLGVTEFCPYCDLQRKSFFAAKERGDQDLMKKWDSRQGNTTHIGNFLIREDLVNPSNNGKVKLWEHTKAINNKLFEPTKPEDKAKQGLKKIQRFNPYSPIKGRDFILIVRESAKNAEWPEYGESTWDELPSDLAPSHDEMIALLDQTHDLQRFLDEVPTVEAITEMMREYDVRVATAEAQRGIAGTSSNFASRTPVVSAASFLNAEPVAEAPRAVVKPVPVQAPVASDTFDLNEPEAQSEEDDLPF
jgi:hypothetical protein